MAKTPSIQELKKQLAAQERKMEKLQTRRDKIAAELEQVDRELAQLTGGGTTSAPTKRRRKKTTKAARKTKSAKKTGRKKSSRGRRGGGEGGKTLEHYIIQVLDQAGEPMRAKEVMQAVDKAGYKSKSKDFYGIVATALRNEDLFKRVSRGVYTLK
jgi:hypothetical protein